MRTATNILAALATNDGVTIPQVQRQRPYDPLVTVTFPLGPLDRRLLELVACGLSDDRIGDGLHLSGRAVRKHVACLRHMLNVGNRAELAAWAGAHGLYQPSGKGQGEVLSQN